MRSSLSLGDTPKVLVEDCDVDLPAGTETDVGNGVLKDGLPERRPRHSDVLGRFLS